MNLTKGNYCYYIGTSTYSEKHEQYMLGVVVRDEPGWRIYGGEDDPVLWGNDYTKAKEMVDEYNKQKGITPKQVQEIIVSSIKASFRGENG